MKLNITLGSIIYCAFSLSANAGGIVSDIPSNPDASGKYIFYLHGSVEEDEGSTEKYEMALEAIAESSAIVISEVREDTNPDTYADKLKNQVNVLIRKGVPAKNITVSGFSKGSIITLVTAGVIQNSDVNYVLLAGCSGYLNQKYGVDPKKAEGRILSIYDSGDEKFGSCSGVINNSDRVRFEEYELDSGKGHKLFRIPKEKFIEQWRDPLVGWAGA